MERKEEKRGRVRGREGGELQNFMVKVIVLFLLFKTVHSNLQLEQVLLPSARKVKVRSNKNFFLVANTDSVFLGSFPFQSGE